MFKFFEAIKDITTLDLLDLIGGGQVGGMCHSPYRHHHHHQICYQTKREPSFYHINMESFQISS